MIKKMQRLNQGDFKEIIKGLQKEVDDYLEDEDSKWCQRAKMKWLRGGDRNTKYFHSCANQRKQPNTIHSISTSEGYWAKSQEEISSLFHKCYYKLFASSQPIEILESLAHLGKSVTDDMSRQLIKDFSSRRLQLLFLR